MRLGRLAGAAVALALAATPSVAVAAPSEPQWHFEAWEVENIWATGAEGQGVTVAVVEGVQPIPDLQDALLRGVDLVDPTRDGRHDYSETGHGTRMAAVIASSGEQTGILGIAPEAKILPVVLSHAPDGRSSFVADGIKWAVDHGAQIINMSFGHDSRAFVDLCPIDIQMAVAYAIDHGAVVVAAAGNEGDTTNNPIYPASCQGVLAVGAVDENAFPWESSQRQPYVDVAAPGVKLAGVDKSGNVVTASGTSISSALTSGAIALVWSAHPELTNRQVVARILATLRDPAAPGTKDPQRGYGTVLPLSAITEDVPLDAPNPVFDELLEVPGYTPPDQTPGAPPPDDNTGGGGDDGTNQADDGSPLDDLALVLLGLGALGGLAALVTLVFVFGRRRQRAPEAPSLSPPWPPTQPAPPWQQPAQQSQQQYPPPPWQNG